MKTLGLLLFWTFFISDAISQTLTATILESLQNQSPDGISIQKISPEFHDRTQANRLRTEEDRLDSSYIWLWHDVDQSYELIRRNLYTTDDQGRVTHWLESYYNGSAWESLSLVIYTYDENDNLTNELHQSWDGASWDIGGQYVNTYDSFNNLTSRVYQEWDGLSWVNSNHIVYTYDNNHNVITQMTGLWGGSDWLNSFLRTYTYDLDNTLTLQVVQNWNAGWVNNQQLYYTYDINGNLDRVLNQRWINNAWEDNYRNLYEYDAQNNLKGLIRQNHLGGDNWVNDYQFVNTYDLFNNQTGQLYQLYVNDEWVNTYEFVERYDDKQNRISEIYRVWEDTGFYQDSTHNYFTLFTGTKDVKQRQTGFFIYPNPATSNLTIHAIPEDVDNLDIEIYSVAGIMMMQGKINLSEQSNIDISELLPGMYSIRILQLGSSTAITFIKN